MNQLYTGASIASFVTVALITQHASQTGGGAQFKCLCTLLSCKGQCPTVIRLGCSLIAGGNREIAAQAMKLGLVLSFLTRLDELRRLGEALLALRQSPELGMGFGH